MRTIKTLAAFAALALAACGGSPGGGSDNPGGGDDQTIRISGAVTASASSYFSGSAAPVSVQRHSLAMGMVRPMSIPVDSFDCNTAYTELFARLTPNIDTNGDSTADLNLTNGAGVVSYSLDTDGDGVADLNIDTDADDVLDRFVDADCDGEADYSMVEPNVVTVTGAEVILTRREDQARAMAATTRAGTFDARVRTGTYDIEIRGQAADRANLWGHARGRVLTESGDLGALGMHRHPLLSEVIVDGESSGTLMQPSHNMRPARELSAGSVVEFQVLAQDPNNRPLTMRVFAHLGSGYTELPVVGNTVQYTVTAADAQLQNLTFFAEVDNGDGRFGFDQYRDTLVNITYKVAGQQTAPLPTLQGFRIGGTLHEHPEGAQSIYAYSAPVQPGASTTIEALFDANAPGQPTMTYTWYTGASTNNRHTFTGQSVVIPPEATYGVHAVIIPTRFHRQDVNQDGMLGTITLPVDTTDLPAQITGIAVNGASPVGAVFRPGDVLTIRALGSDPKGLPMEYRFSVRGGAVQDFPWSASDSITYVVTATDAVPSFSIRAWVRNSDGRVLDASTDYDATQGTALVISE